MRALTLVLEQLPFAAAMLDRDLRYLAVSGRWRQEYGLGGQQLVGRHHYDAFPEIRNLHEWQAVHQRALAGAIERREEDRFVRADGTEVWQSWEVRPWRDVAGDIGGILIFTEDITARKRSERTLQAVIDNAPIGIVVASPTFEIVAMNPEALRIHGFTSQEEMFSRLDQYVENFELLEPDGRPLPFQQWPALRIRSGESLLAEELLLVRRGTGHKRNVRYVAAPLLGAAGELTAYLFYMVDLTGIRRAQRALQASEERLALALASAGAGSWEWAVRSGALAWSDGTYRLLGYAPDEIEPGYEAWLARVHPEDRAVEETKLRACMEQPASGYDSEYRVVWPDGSVHWLEARGRFYFDDAGAQRMYGVLIDVTRRKLAEMERLRASDELEQRVRERTAQLQQRRDQLARLASELVLAEKRERRRVAAILHDELQQLLVGAKYGLDALADEVTAGERETVRRIDRLIAQSLSVSRTLTSELSPVVLDQMGLAAGLSWLARSMAQKHGLKVELIVEPGLLVPREDVRELVFESIREALFNVVKHAGVRAARVEVWRRADGELFVAVSDQGRGFDRARMAEQDFSVSGGFGLFGIRERLELLGGQMQIDSAPLEGTRLQMRVPLIGGPSGPQGSEARQPSAEAGASRRGTTIRLLVVDDHPVVREGLVAMFRGRADITVVGEAATGTEAIAQARALHPDVILMDHSMPDMSGVEATRAIHGEFPKVRIIGLSMHEEAAIAEAMIDAGASIYLIKSGDSDALLEAIRSQV